MAVDGHSHMNTLDLVTATGKPHLDSAKLKSVFVAFQIGPDSHCKTLIHTLYPAS